MYTQQNVIGINKLENDQTFSYLLLLLLLVAGFFVQQIALVVHIIF